ncbi:MAG: PEGA domain-containing protein [Candidatus Gottesmanbacteria bacterium]|nr:PEGA domain-containing protein [Candidatus Gottesmanbacteria bacterium]
MTWKKTGTIVSTLLTICLILSASAILIGYGRGYRINVNKPTQLSTTGLISATSDPVGAQVLIDSKLKTATNNSFAIAPNWYTVRIIKEGYIGWEKKLRVQGEVVTRAEAYLFPTSPSLSPITTSGLLAPALSPDGGKIAFIVPTDATPDGVKKPGLYTLELSDRPLGRNRDPKFIVGLAITSPMRASPGAAPLTVSKEGPSLYWSPDAGQIVIIHEANILIVDLTRSPVMALPLAQNDFDLLQKEWKKEKESKDRQKLISFKQGFIDVATSSARIVSFSPDESKLLYEATAAATIPQVILPPMIGTNPTEEVRTITPGNLYVYDSKEDRNYFLLAKKELPTPTAHPKPPQATRPSSSSIGLLDNWIIGNSTASNAVAWFPTSRHLLLVISGKIDVMEYDRTNWTTLYSGPFDGSFLAPWPTGSRLVILTNLNPGASTLPNLYTVNLR